VLAQAINESGAGVQATVVDVGTGSAPDYRLSLAKRSTGSGDHAVERREPEPDVHQPDRCAGAVHAQRTAHRSSASDAVTLAPGLTAQLTNTNTAPATVTVAADPSGVGTALQSFVTAYNTAMTELDNNRGQTDVALAGQSIVYQLTEDLQNLANYAGGGANISSLAALGVQFADTTGALSFDQSTFDTAASGQTGALTQFLGAAAGGGFLGAATNAMSVILAPTSGVLTDESSSVESNITDTNTQITAKEAAVTQLQSNLTQQMAAADTLIYTLQQQQSEMQQMFNAEQDNELEAASV
jgi:flagellar hook-associated protein 2